MTHYVLDSTVLIEFSKGVEPTTARVLELVAAKAKLSISAVQLAEYYAGTPLGANPQIDEFLLRLAFVPLSRDIAITAGAFRLTAQSQGRRLATPDALIAALGHHLAAPVLTNNVNDFKVTGVAVEHLGGAGKSAS